MSGILLFFFLPPSSKPPSYLVCWRVLWTDTARCVLIEITDKPISWTLLFQFLFQPPSLPLSLFWLFCPESQFFFERKNQQIVAKARNGIHSLDLLFLSPSTQLARKRKKAIMIRNLLGPFLNREDIKNGCFTNDWRILLLLCKRTYGMNTKMHNLFMGFLF